MVRNKALGSRRHFPFVAPAIGKEGLNAAVRSVPGMFQKKESARSAAGGTFHL
jgi:hypothetical protein